MRYINKQSSEARTKTKFKINIVHVITSEMQKFHRMLIFILINERTLSNIQAQTRACNTHGQLIHLPVVI